eukprot:768805-Hanusia_phi.AAC.12
MDVHGGVAKDGDALLERALEQRAGGVGNGAGRQADELEAGAANEEGSKDSRPLVRDLGVAAEV